VKITFYGGAREVGRNCFGLGEEGRSLLVDAGVNVGGEEGDIDPLLTDPKAYPEIAISHAHLDHIGYLPIMYSRKYGCKAPIYSTKPTHDLMALLLADYQRLSHRFSVDDIKRVMAHCRAVKYGQIGGKGLKFSFHNSGHIIGSSLVLVHGKRRILYTGDMNNRATRTLEPCQTGLRADTLIMESTYGAPEDVHEPLKEVSRKLMASIESTLKRGGSVLIPSFAVGRAQEVLFMLEQHMTSGALTNVPIYVDGMILKANRIYRQNIDFAKDEARRRVLHSGQNPFDSKHFKVPRSRMKSDVLQQQAIIVSTSGMLTGGPAHTYMRALAGNPANLLAFVGYQAEGTPGRAILDGAREVKLSDSEEELPLKINMRVEKFDLSAHSDQAGLVQFARSTKGLKRIFLVHGEEKKLGALAEALRRYEVTIPKNGESFRV
jgi:predicted metal-dependent RNase